MGLMHPCFSAERFERLVNAQSGRITRAQLRQLGVSDTMLRGWIQTSRVHRVLPRVYAVGHTAPSREADLWTAILYAGPGAMLSHATAAHWRGLIDHAPRLIEVATPRKIKPAGRVTVYSQREHERDFHEGLPVTAIPQTLIDLASSGNLKVVRRALANLDYRDELDPGALSTVCEHGRPGSARLKQALEIHQPELAHTNGSFEERFLEWCERWGIPVPSFNVNLHGILVDAHWHGTKLAVELDGAANHRTKAQLHRDMTNDLALRRHGITVHRYEWTQLQVQGRAIRAEILARLGGACPPGAPTPGAPGATH